MFQRLEKIKSEFLGINHRNVGYVFTMNQRKDYKLADDKVLAKEILERENIPCARTYAVIEKVGDIPVVWGEMKKYETLAIKPANGSGGEGIKIIKKVGENRWSSGSEVLSEDQLYLFMASIIMGFYSLGSSDRVLVEECIVPHDCFHSIYPRGVADLRLILYKEQFALAMLRLPTDQSDGKANLHQGGLGIGIDLTTGEMGQAYNGKEYFDVHPDTAEQIKGRLVPFWDEILDLSLKTAKAFPLKYLGVDVVIDATKGPIVMEVNVRPGLAIQMVNRTGLKKILKKIDKGVG